MMKHNQKKYYPPRLRVIPTDVRVPLCASGSEEGLKDFGSQSIYVEGDF